MAIAPSSRVSSRAAFRDSLCSTGIQCSTAKTRCRDGACPVSLRGGRRGKPCLYREFGDERKNSEVQQFVLRRSIVRQIRSKMHSRYCLDTGGSARLRYGAILTLFVDNQEKRCSHPIA
jgi:hypothetical protein